MTQEKKITPGYWWVDHEHGPFIVSVVPNELKAQLEESLQNLPQGTLERELMVFMIDEEGSVRIEDIGIERFLMPVVNPAVKVEMSKLIKQPTNEEIFVGVSESIQEVEDKRILQSLTEFAQATDEKRAEIISALDAKLNVSVTKKRYYVSKPLHFVFMGKKGKRGQNRSTRWKTVIEFNDFKFTGNRTFATEKAADKAIAKLNHAIDFNGLRNK